MGIIDVTLSDARLRWDYNKETGVITSKIKTVQKQIGDPVGYVAKNGYVYIYFRGKTLLAHRLAWFLIYGRWPSGIDHIDGNPLNNSLNNLREANPSVNAKNQRRKKSRSGANGVFWRAEKGKWIAYIKVNYKRINLGSFITKEEAIQARKEADTKYGFHPNHGRD